MANSFLSPYEILPIAQEIKYLVIFLFYHEIVCCVYSLYELGDSNENTRCIIIV